MISVHHQAEYKKKIMSNAIHNTKHAITEHNQRICAIPKIVDMKVKSNKKKLLILTMVS